MSKKRAILALGPFNIKNPHARKSTYQVPLLVAVDLDSGMLSAHIMPSLKKDDVILALEDLSYKYRMPAQICTDAGSNLRFLESSELFQVLSSSSIQLVNLPQGHQFANYAESQIRIFKSLMATGNEDTNRSIFAQPCD